MWLLRYLVCTIDCLSYRRSVQRSEACTGSAPATAGGPVLLRRRQEMPLPLSLQGAPLVLLSVPRVAPRCVRAVDMHWARKRPPLPGTSRAGKPPGMASWQPRTGATMQSSPFVSPAAMFSASSAGETPLHGSAAPGSAICRPPFPRERLLPPGRVSSQSTGAHPLEAQALAAPPGEMPYPRGDPRGLGVDHLCGQVLPERGRLCLYTRQAIPYQVV